LKETHLFLVLISNLSVLYIILLPPITYYSYIKKCVASYNVQMLNNIIAFLLFDHFTNNHKKPADKMIPII